MEAISNVTQANDLTTPNLPGEEWRDITDPAVKDMYQVSNMGRVRNSKGELLKIRPESGGIYLRVGLMKAKPCRKSYSLNRSIHRLVAFAFLPPPMEGQVQVDHIDGNPRNNRADNLRWVTREQNAHNAVTEKRREASMVKITSYTRVKVRDDETGEIFDSMEAAADHYGIDSETVRKICEFTAKYPGKSRRRDAFPYKLSRIDTVKELPSLEERLRIALTPCNQEHAIPIRCVDDEIEIIFPSALSAATAYRLHHKTVRGSCELTARDASRQTHFSKAASKHFAYATREEYQAWAAQYQEQEDN